MSTKIQESQGTSEQQFDLIETHDLSQAFFTSYQNDGKFITFYGDSHPYYAGSVVKAMASAKNGYPHVAELFADDIRRTELAMEQNADFSESRAELEAFFNNLDHLFKPYVVSVEKLTPTIVEIVVHAPMAARKFQPGEFYRLQNYEADPVIIDGKPYNFEGLAMTGAWTDPAKGLLSMIVLEIGASTMLTAYLRPGQRVVVMGPTGAPTHIPENETVLLAGGGLGNAVLFSISHALKANGCKVLYFAGYKNGADVFKMEEIERATDQVIWCSDSGPEIMPRRPQDTHVRCNIVQAIQRYAEGDLENRLIDLSEVSRIIAIGSDGMMNAVRMARHGVLKPYLGKHIAIGSINSPMQCMMKEICAQCLQKHIDPITGNPLPPVFSCFNQDQELDMVDFQNLRDRLRQNSLLEKLSTSWLSYMISYNT